MELGFCCKRCLKGMTLLLNYFDQIQFISYKKSVFATVAADSLSRPTTLPSPKKINPCMVRTEVCTYAQGVLPGCILSPQITFHSKQ